MQLFQTTVKHLQLTKGSKMLTFHLTPYGKSIQNLLCSSTYYDSLHPSTVGTSNWNTKYLDLSLQIYTLNSNRHQQHWEKYKKTKTHLL